MSLAYLAHRKCVYISIHCYYHSLNLLGSETKACCRWSSGEGLSSNHGCDSTKWDCWILLLTWILSAQSPSYWNSSVQLPNGSQFFPIWPRSSHLLPPLCPLGFLPALSCSHIWRACQPLGSPVYISTDHPILSVTPGTRGAS